MKQTIMRVLRDDRGATAIEYGLIAALISIAMVVALESMGGSLSTFFGTTSGHLSNAAGPSP